MDNLIEIAEEQKEYYIKQINKKTKFISKNKLNNINKSELNLDLEIKSILKGIEEDENFYNNNNLTNSKLNSVNNNPKVNVYDYSYNDNSDEDDGEINSLNDNYDIIIFLNGKIIHAHLIAF